MGSQNPFTVEDIKRHMINDKGLFSGQLEWSRDNINWNKDQLQINLIGQLTISYQVSQISVVENSEIRLNNSNFYNLVDANGKFSQDVDSNPYRDIIIKNVHSSAVQFVSTAPVVLVVLVNQEKGYFRAAPGDRTQFIRFVAALMIWQNMNIYGIHNKYFAIPLPFADSAKASTAGQSIQVNDEDNEDNVIIINKEEKNLLVCRFKVYGPVPKISKKSIEIPGPPNPLYPAPGEGWFFAMGVLKLNGVLDLLSESDGTLLYSLNISSLIRLEIRKLHHSLFESLNLLFIGVIDELRETNLNANTCPAVQKPKFFIASPTTKSTELKNSASLRILIDFPLHIDLEDWYVALKSLTAREYVGINAHYSAKSSFRISKHLNVDIIEASFEGPLASSDDEGTAVKLYSDIVFWNSTWARTSVVETSSYLFWREEFEFDLPIKTNDLQIVIKRSASAPAKKTKKPAGDSDPVVGHVAISEELIETSDNKETWIPVLDPESNEKVGQICVRINLKEWHLLPPLNFEVLQKMLLNTSLNDLIEFLGSLDLKFEDLEETSNMMLDIFQALHTEDVWFAALIDFELAKVGMMMKANRQSLTGISANFFNTLFRGNSILTKTFEKYNLRVGQEFLEKVVGDFVLQVAVDKYECEIDPARIKGTAEEKEFTIDDNFMRLFEYVETIWAKIYNSCNDLPQPIRKELEIFRNKLEEACDPLDPKSASLALNCVTGFLFLRLICPAILNPKLFFLTKDHQTGNVKRSLTLISKILLTLSNRTRFGAKEPWLIKMNYFLEQHEAELLDYLDIITNRKPDDRPKILDLSDTVTRPDISISLQISAELPTNPFLIDKHLRLTQLSTILSAELVNQQDEFNFEPGNSRNSFRNSYRIGSSAFEEQVIKNNNLAFASEELLKNLSLLSSSSRASSNITRNSQVSLADIKQESYFVIKKINGLDHLLTSFENPSVIYANWGKFVNNVTEAGVLDSRKRLLYTTSDYPGFKKISEDGLGFLKAERQTPTLSKLIKSASANTLISPNKNSFDDSLKESGNKSPFKKTFFWRKGN